MFKKTIVSVIIIGITLNLSAFDFNMDFHRKYRESVAESLFRNGKYQEAQTAFEKLSSTAPDALEKAKWASRAAIALAYQKKIDPAMQMAKAITEKPFADYTLMKILSIEDKNKEIVTTYKDENIALWPADIRYKGFFVRGGAYEETGNKQAAIKDFEQCVEHAGSDNQIKLDTLYKIAAHYKNLNNDDKALEAYQKALAIYDLKKKGIGSSLYARTCLGTAGILKSQKKYDEALELLNNYAGKGATWKANVLAATGDIYAIIGEKDKAVAKYREALRYNQKHKKFVDNIIKKIEDLKKK